MGEPSKLKSDESLEGTSFCNACTEKKKLGTQSVYPTRHWYVLLLNVGLHAGISAQNR